MFALRYSLQHGGGLVQLRRAGGELASFGMVETLPPWDSFEKYLHWDQGYLNAMRLKYDVPLVDLGYAFNWVGSFHSTNAGNAPFPAFRVPSSTGRRACSCRIWSEASTLSVSRAWDLVAVCERVVVVIR